MCKKRRKTPNIHRFYPVNVRNGGRFFCFLAEDFGTLFAKHIIA